MIDFDKYLIPAEEAVIATKDNNVENAIKKLYEYMKDKGMTVVSKNHPSVKDYYSDVKFDKEINYKGSFFGIESNPSIQGLTDYKINFIIVPKNNKKDTPYPDSWTISEVNQKLNNYGSATDSNFR